jgi:hypothetical protein
LANGSVGPNTITFDAAVNGGTITLRMGELVITDSVSINASSLTNGITIDASGNDPTPTQDNGDGSRLFNIDDANDANLIDVSISGLTLINGDTIAQGGAILSRENLTVARSTLTGNVTTSGGIAGGGAIYSAPRTGAVLANSLRVTDSIINANRANSEGGGIRKRFGSLIIERSTISGNRAGAAGGGISAADGGTTQISETTIRDNVAVGMGEFDGGGGLFLFNDAATITNSTISGNSATLAGGGIWSNTDLTGLNLSISGSTISGNTASGRGGGIYNFDGLITVEHSTITSNTAPVGSGGGIDSSGNTNTRTEIEGSIVAGNVGSDVDFGPGESNSFQSNGYNLLSTGNALAAFNSNGDSIVVNPMLLPLANNGGPTQTHRLQFGSPAINAGDPDFAEAADFDQRGSGFPRLVFGRIDMGAVEFGEQLPTNLVVDFAGDEFDGDFEPGDLSLREAIWVSNIDPEVRSITFASNLSGATLVLDMGELAITDSVTINASSLANGITIDASGNDPTPTQDNGDGSRVFNIDDANDANFIDVSIEGVTLTGGDENDSGGAIFTRENLTVERSTITGNITTRGNDGSFGGGGGIFSTDGTLTVLDSSFSHNRAVNGEGGAIRKRFGALSIERSTISQNIARTAGGGFSAADGNVAVQVRDSVVSGNSTTGPDFGGGGVFVFTASATITRSTISDNSAVGGGGINGRNSVVNLIDSTVSGNTASRGGGGVYIRIGTLNVTQSTISGNTASGDGGGIFSLNSNCSASNSTISKNTAGTVVEGPGSGGGIYLGGTGTARLDHVILADNTDHSAASPDLDATTAATVPTFSVLHSLIGDNTGSGLSAAPLGSPDLNGNLIGDPTASGVIGPRLRPLADRGGLTQTHALSFDSPAINAGDPAATGEGVPPFDQRGGPFDRVANGRIDIGAFEAPATAFRDNIGFQQNVLERNDDLSTEELVSIGFDINFFGAIFSQLFVNNNGNVTFGQSLSTYTPNSLLTTNRIIVAPFWADVDTRGIGSVTYGQDVVDGRAAFGVNWSDVGYFGSQSDKVNSFQLVLIDRSDLAPGAFDFEFNYAVVEWESGNASGGMDGLGGNSARAGFSNGSNRSFELPGSDVDGAFLDSNSATGLIHNSRGSDIAGRYRFVVRNGVTDLSAANDGTSTLAGTAVTIDVLANDETFEGLLDPTSVTIVGQPGHGVVTVHPVTGAISYTPDSSFVGEDSFTYTVANDSGSVSNEATVTVQITPPIEAPDAEEPPPPPEPPVEVPQLPPLPPQSAQLSLLLLSEPIVPIVPSSVEYGSNGYYAPPQQQGAVSVAGGSPQAVDAAFANDEVSEPFLLTGFLDFVEPEMLVVDLGDEPPAQVGSEPSRAAGVRENEKEPAAAAPSLDQIGAGGGPEGESDGAVLYMKPPLEATPEPSSMVTQGLAVATFVATHWRWFASTAAVMLLTGAAWKSRSTWLRAARKPRSR